MFSLCYLITQAQQPQRLPWGFLVLFGLLAVAAVGLLIYFLTRVRKSEKDAEDDWGLANRGILLSPTTLAAPGVKKTSETPPEQAPIAKKTEPPVIAVSEASAEPESEAKTVSPTEPEVLSQTPEVPPTGVLEIVPPPVPVASELDHETVAQARPTLEAAPAALEQADHAGSPFDEEIWSQLESPQPDVAGEAEFGRPATAASTHREPYEPPRIDPILPRKEQAQKGELPVRAAGPPASASEYSPVRQARLEAQPPVSKSGKAAPVPAGSILGLPAEASAGPFIIDRSRAHEDAAGVGTLANYDKAPDDAAGHSGTIALIIVIVLVCASLGGYFTVPSVRSRIDNLVARVRGIKEPPRTVAQIFPSTLDETKEPAVAKGALQNITDESLFGLVVTVSLEPRGGGAAVTQDVQVTPDEILPGQQGTYEFQIETKRYQRYKVVGLKSKDGVTLAYVKPNQQQQ